MKKSFTYPLLAAMLLGSASMSAESVKLLTFTVPAEAEGLARSFQISANDGQSIQVDWGDGELSAPVALANYDDPGWVFTEVSGVIKGTTVTVWGTDPATINYIELSWDKANSVDTKIKSVNLSRLTGVKEITIDTNQLTKLDVSKNVAATSVKADNNQLESITLPETGAESVLTTLSVQNTIDANTGVLNGNNQLLGADFASAPNLTSLNLSYNTELGWFDTFSIAENTKLKTLNITGCGLDESYFDFSKLPALATLNANFNKFKSIDLTGIAKKAYVYLNDNELTSVTPSAEIKRLQIKNNYFTFTSLPEVAITGLNFAYAPQHDIPVGLGKGATVDLASQLTAGDKATVYKWMQGETELEAGTAYTADNGVFTFKQPVNKAVCEMTNEKFPSLTLKSSEVTSPEFLEAIATFTVNYDPANELPVHIEAFSLLPEGTPLQIGAGDGTVSAPVVAPSDGWDGAIFDVVPAGTVISLYGDDSLKNLLVSCNSDRYPVESVDVSKLTKLESLSMSNNNITTIDLNANKALKSLSLTSNKLGALSLDLPALTSLSLNNYATSGENRLEGSDFSKCPALTSINLNYTGLTSFDLSKLPALKSAYLMGNEIASIDLPASENLTYISLNSNKLTSLDASGCLPRMTLYANDNNLTEVKVPAEYAGSISVKNNKLTFATMPKTTGELTYAPQQDMEIAANDGKVDLSAQYMVDGKTTVYSWTAGNAILTEGTDYTMEDGVFTFLGSFADAACSMTNEAYPDLTLATMPVAIVVTGIEDVENAAVTVSAANGAIIIEGDFTAATIADMAGRTIAAKAVTPVAAGIYVVNVDGKAVKVAVK